MGHETVQTRYSVKQIAPRLVLGIIASNASLWIIAQSVALANALAAALMTKDVSADGIGDRLTQMIIIQLFGPAAVVSVFNKILGLVLAALGVTLLVTYLLRATVLILLTAGAPLAFACHALPQTEGLAKLWWRAIFGCAATQLGQALVLITAVQVLFDPHASALLGIPSAGGFLDLLICLVMFLILMKIPIWATRIVMGRSPFGMTMVGRLARTFLMWKVFGRLLPNARGGTARRRQGPGVWRNNLGPPQRPPQQGPPQPGAGLAPISPGPGGSPGGGWSPKPPTMTATQASPPPARPHGPPAPAALGPSRKAPLALPIGRTARLDRKHQATAAAPPSPGRQYGLFPPPERIPRAAVGTAQPERQPTPQAWPASTMPGQEPLIVKTRQRHAAAGVPAGPARQPMTPVFIAPSDFRPPPKRRPKPAAEPRPPLTVNPNAEPPPRQAPQPETGA